MSESHGLYIDGKWEIPPGAKTFSTHNPATGDELGTFVAARPEDVERAVAAAHKAFKSWREVPAPKRGRILLQAAEIYRRDKASLGRTVTMEMGKILPEGLGDVQEAIDFIEYASGEGRRLLGETVPSELRNKACLTLRQPKGVVAAITPWNFPTAIPNWKIAAALISGNTVVFKPASNTALCGTRVVQAYAEAGLPAGVLNLVTGSGGVVGDTLVSDPRVRAVSFTGGSDTGREVYLKGAQKLKYVHLELGGKNPQIVMDDANLDLALEGVLFGAFGAVEETGTQMAGSLKPIEASDVAVMMAYAGKVIIAPGYGMAVAQAQHKVKELMDVLEQKGVTVKFAIHPVAGRMPGHMNVLLAEAGVPYDRLFDRDEINPEFASADVVLVIGANDTVNPAARRAGSPLQGMPILDVDQAKNVIVLKRGQGKGFAGVENDLFYKDNTRMLYGDAQETVTKLVQELKKL